LNIRSAIHRSLGAFGLELRLQKNIVAAHRRAREEAERERWRLLRAYGIGTILDVGANEGQFAALMREVCPSARIYSFEPLPDVYARLEAAYRNDLMVTTVNLALGAEAGEVQMNRSEFSPSSSLLPMAELHRQEWPQSAGHTQVPVRLARLDDWMVEANPQLAGELLVKLDVQGYEAAVIDGAADTLRRARLVVSEVSFYELYEGQPLFAEIHARMAALGFRFRGNIEQHHSQKCDRILFADAVFENTQLVDAT
jgi:FkbM family methyltransferase